MTLTPTIYRFETPSGVYELRATDEAHAWRVLRIKYGYGPESAVLFAQEPAPRGY